MRNAAKQLRLEYYASTDCAIACSMKKVSGVKCRLIIRKGLAVCQLSVCRQ